MNDIAFADGDVIRVGQGTYYPHPTDRTISFDLPDNVTIQGGYRGINSGGDPNALNPTTFVTILSGDINHATSPDLDAGNSRHVLTAFSAFGEPVEEDHVLQGVTITQGYAEGTFSEGSGAGILVGHRDQSNSQASPTLRNCVFNDNYAIRDGGAAMVYGKSFLSRICAPRFRASHFHDNEAGRNGGAIALGDPDFFDNNEAEVSSSQIENNEAGNIGGGVAILRGAGTVLSSIVEGNEGRSGGGIGYGDVRPYPSLVNVVVAGNHATLEGGGVAIQKSGHDIINCTIVGNTSAGDGGGLLLVHHSATTMALHNTILWGNEADGDGDHLYIESITVDMDYCDLEDGNTSPGVVVSGGTLNFLGHNIDDDPLLSGDYRLNAASPCRDEGDPDDSIIPVDSANIDEDGSDTERLPDIDLGLRVLGATVDIGAHEVCDLFADLSGNGAVDFADILEILAVWGTTGSPPEDLSGNGVVDFADILAVLAAWGDVCPNKPPVDSIETVFIEAGLDYEIDWPNYRNCVETGTAAEQDNCNCWMEHYYYTHYLQTCFCSPNCPDDDPFGGH